LNTIAGIEEKRTMRTDDCNRNDFQKRTTGGSPVLSVRILALAFAISTPAAFGQTLTTLYSFGSSPGDGADPQAGVAFDNRGNLYGTAALGGTGNNGILFRLSPPAKAGDPWTESILHAFQSKPDGATPECRLVVNSAGTLYGTTWQGGAKNMGTAFAAFPPSTGTGPWTVGVIHNFGSARGDGVNPNAGLLAAGSALYGVTFGGGATGRGTVFQLTPPAGPGGQWTETALYSFGGAPDAAFPSSEVVMDSNGNLYGTTTLGGANDLGAVYRLSPPAQASDPWTETVIYSFNGTDGTLPAGRLQIDSQGSVYGTTDGGGALQEGTVFRLDPPQNGGASWNETVLYSFSGGRDGGNPSAGVTIGNRGQLAGTASSGGNLSGGLLFQLTPPAGQGADWTETVLNSFSWPDGFRPVSILTPADGGLYGVTSEGGIFGTGTVFVLGP
jgi:uncharacterized repeat protein (TIGR03803 family)